MQNANLHESEQALGLDDLRPFRQFARECEQRKLATEQQLRWWFRFRKENGLLDSGAVVEMHPTGNRRSRPSLYVVVPRFTAWLAGARRSA